MIYGMHSIHLSFDQSGTAAQRMQRISAGTLNLPEAARAVSLKTHRYRTLVSEKFGNVQAALQNGSTPRQ
ncbi:hypothetical protein [Burkholderia sp. TSV86]|uniref:hypothetical protein n=1 Tax=Burkholderia sp. TSV86 TaxID=1385594 RepID=UPI00075B81CC|nr:hypothetical protein [Burkholderia sp. TSV86]KVE32424.1 hypothetical protein WS68_14725 [Burkholderia sp. TSV86]